MSEQAYPGFWRQYLQNHAQPGTRALHYAGTLVGATGVVAGIVNLNIWLALTGIAVGYVFAWLGHFLIEHNRPCTLRHPAWSLGSDLRMFRLWLGGGLLSELRKAGITPR